LVGLQFSKAGRWITVAQLVGGNGVFDGLGGRCRAGKKTMQKKNPE
jgi:hypothetical protein